jgi:uncharacterized protein (DUF1499 family)
MSESRKAWLHWLARLTLLAGVVLGIVALAAPLGVWIGAWNFQTGFRILFNPESVNVTTAAPWIAGIAAVVSVLGFSLGGRDARRYGTLAAVGALIAGIGYVVPNSYRPGPEIPPIHDITTDTQDPPAFVDILPLRADAPNTTVYGGGPNQTPESLAAQQRQAYPDIVTREFDESAAAVFARAAAAARTLGWDIVAENVDEGRIEATDTTFWFRFKDDIVIRIRPTPTGAALDARSVSRVGLSDAGKNAARLRAFFEAIG